MTQAAPLRFSIVIPTYQRRALAINSVRALMGQEYDGGFEVVVVVDGSQDGTAEALGRIDTPFPLTILQQPNRGLSTARNEGAAAARGEILLFLDDDMEAHPRLLVEHDRSHREGADVVLGHIPLHPQSPANILSAAVKDWAESRGLKLSSPGARLTLHDLLAGQLSLPREIFDRVGGFDARFTHGGTFGDEDIDFGHRLTLAGYRIVFNPHAISWQQYVVGPRQHLRQWRQAGAADVAFARKHPDQADALFALQNVHFWTNRRVWRPLVAVPLLTAPLMAVLRSLAIALVERGAQGPLTARFFFEIRAMEYWRGVRGAGGLPRPCPLRVLAYHAINDLAGAPVVEPYGVPPKTFRHQLKTLQRAGFRFISADEFLHFLHRGGGLPRHPLLLTFDDGYQELLDFALPMLKERRIPAVVFAVSGRLGGTNEWDEACGAPRLRLLDLNGLRELAQAGVEIGAHSRTHRPLSSLPDEELADEVAGSVADLEASGLDRPRLFAYPEGDYDERTVRAVGDAGLQAGFTVVPGRVRPGNDPYQIPRIEILRRDVGWRFLWKVMTAGRLTWRPWGLGFLSRNSLRRHLRWMSS